jgi:hypothetical protein
MIVWLLGLLLTARYQDLGASYFASRIDKKPQDPEPRPRVRSPRLRCQPHLGRLTHPHITGKPKAGFAGADARSSEVGHFPVRFIYGSEIGVITEADLGRGGGVCPTIVVR